MTPTAGDHMTKHVLIALALGACSDSTSHHDVDDHAAGRLALEGAELATFFGDDLVSDPIQLGDGFRRVGLLWDSAIEGAFELRTSHDGTTWSEWQSPAVSSAEDIAHAGHLDAIATGPDGSLATDPIASHVQLRTTTATALAFLVVEPLLDIPPLLADAGLDDDAEEPMDDARGTGIGDLKVHSRAAWGARKPRCAMDRASPNRVTIHHTVTPTNDSLSPQARLRQIQAFHQNTNGWCDIGYNYLVSRDGRIWRARGAINVGAHVANNNTGNVGISFMGTHTSTPASAKQMCEAAKLIRRLHLDHPAIALTRSDVKGHRQYGGTACPGNALYGQIDKILRKAKNGCDAN